MSKREELLDMAVHALTPLMRGRQQATADDLFDESVDIASKLIASVDAAVAQNSDAPPRDELMDMGIHALSALLNGRPSASVDELISECIEVAQSLIAKVDESVAVGGSGPDREELMDVAVHVQTAFLSSRPKMGADELSALCVSVGKKLVSKVDDAIA